MQSAATVALEGVQWQQYVTWTLQTLATLAAIASAIAVWRQDRAQRLERQRMDPRFWRYEHRLSEVERQQKWESHLMSFRPTFYEQDSQSPARKRDIMENRRGWPD